MSSVARTRKPKAPTLREADWAPHKERIIQLHITDNLPLKDVRAIMERERGFNPEIRQYRLRISKWRLDKNVKTIEMKAIVRRLQHRSLAETDRPGLRFRVREQEVEPEKVERWMRAHNIDEEQLYAPSSVASTPSAVDYWTMSEQDTPTQSPDRTPVQSPFLRSIRYIDAATESSVEEISGSPLDMLLATITTPFLPAPSSNREVTRFESDGKAKVIHNAEPGFSSDIGELSKTLEHVALTVEDTTKAVATRNNTESDARNIRPSESLTISMGGRNLAEVSTPLVKHPNPLFSRWECCKCHGDNSWYSNLDCIACPHHLMCSNCVVYMAFVYGPISRRWGELGDLYDELMNSKA